MIRTFSAMTVMGLATALSVPVAALALSESAIDPMVTTNARVTYSVAGVVPMADSVPGRRIAIRVKGTRFGKKATVRIEGTRGNASGVLRTVRVEKRKTVRNLKSGRYKISALKIRSNGKVAKASVKPRRVTVTRKRGANVVVRYRLIVKPNLRPETITAGYDHTCALDADGKAWCWGRDDVGQLGADRAEKRRKYSPIPVTVAGGRSFTTISAGAGFTCALDAGSKAWCWGSDSFGQLGNGRKQDEPMYSPSAVVGGREFTTISAGNGVACALDTTGRAWCWGSDGSGQLGNGKRSDGTRHAPVAVAGDRSFAVITAGGAHNCALDTTGKAFCWGSDDFGQLGNGREDRKLKYSPVAVAGGRSYVAIDTGEDHTCGLSPSGKAFCWGLDGFGQIGNGDFDNPDLRALGDFGPATVVHAPTAVAGGRSYVTVNGGHGHTCALEKGGKAFCWGYDVYGQVGDGPRKPNNKYAPAAVRGKRSYAAITAGLWHSCALRIDGRAYCWGSDRWGQVGNDDGRRAEQHSPVRVAGSRSYLTP